MSLLDDWNAEVLLYPEIVTHDRDGNIMTKASDTPVPLKVWLQIRGQSGTASRRSERQDEGWETEQVLSMRLRRQDTDMEIGAQAKVVWRGEEYSVFGDVDRYIGSPRTRHDMYSLRRS